MGKAKPKKTNKVNKTSKKQQNTNMQKLLAGIFVVAFGVIGFLVLTNTSAEVVPGGPASLTVNPQSNNVTQGQEVDVVIQMDTGGEVANAVQANFTYPADKLELVSISSCADGEFTITAQEDTSVAGEVKVACGSIAGQSGVVTVTTTRFRALSGDSTAAINFDEVLSSVKRRSDSASILGSTTGSTIAFTLPPPVINNISPTTGSSLGGTTVTISGTDFGPGSLTVEFGGVPAASIVSQTSDQIVVTTPAVNPSTVGVSVTVEGQTTSLTNAFTFEDITAPNVPAQPTLSSRNYRSLEIAWVATSDVGGSGIAGYNLFRNGVKLNGSLLTGTTYSDSGLEPNTSFNYTVQAVDNAGNESSQSTQLATSTKKLGDINGDDVVNITDLSILIANYQSDLSSADFDDSGLVDITDLSILLSNYEG